MLGNAVVDRYLVNNLTIPSIAAVTTTEVAVTLNGARVGDSGFAVPRGAALTNGLVINYVRVTGNDAGVIAFTNASADAIDAADTFEFDVFLFKASGQLSGTIGS